MLFGNFVPFNAVLDIVVELFALLIWKFVQVKFKFLVIGLLILRLELFNDRNYSAKLDCIELTNLLDQQMSITNVDLLRVIKVINFNLRIFFRKSAFNL